MSTESGSKGAFRRWRDVALAVCVAWLVVQNLLLLTVVAWAHPGSSLVAIAKVARVMAVHAWPAAPVVGLVMAFAVYLVYSSVASRTQQPSEARHGG